MPHSPYECDSSVAIPKKRKGIAMSKLVKQITQTAQTTTRAITAIWIALALQATVIHAQTGDFNGDGLWNCSDSYELSTAIVSGGSTQIFDLNGDGMLGQADMTSWLGLAGNANLGPGESYIYGDLTLNGYADLADADIIQFSAYTTGTGYCRGDLNVDGRVDAYDNAIMFANLFTNYESVDGAGSDGTPTLGLLDYIYDPDSGKMWVDAGGDVVNGWAIPGPEAIEHNELANSFGEFGTFFRPSIFFAGAEQVINRNFPLTGIFQINTYDAGLNEADFGEVITTRLPDRFQNGSTPWETTSPRTSRVVVATVNQWNGGSGSWISANWQDGAAPQPGQVAILDFGTDSVIINENETATSVKTLIRSGTLTINGTHTGDVSVFDTSATPEHGPNSAMAAIAGNGLVDGNLTLMGRFRLQEPATLLVTGEAMLSTGFTVSLSATQVSGEAQLNVTADFALAAGNSTGEFAVISATEGITGVFGDLSVGDEFGTGDLFVESLTYTDNEVLISLGRSLPGDANRDGVVDVSDFNVWNEFKFTGDSTWDTGDFNGDGLTDTSDFNIWNEFKFTSGNLNAVPEPAADILVILSMLAMACQARQQKRSVH